MPGGNLDVRDWLLAGKRLGAMTRCSQWWLGDWVRYGSARWGEKYQQASRITGYDVKSLRNLAYVAGRFEVSRRRDTLTWSHHAEVSALNPSHQDEWLDRAAEEKLSVSDLRLELRAARRGEERDDKPADPRKATVTCPHCEHEFDLASALRALAAGRASGPAFASGDDESG